MNPHDKDWDEVERRRTPTLSKFDREWISEVISGLGQNVHDVKEQNTEIIAELRGKGDRKGLFGRVELLEHKVNQLWLTVYGLAAVLLTTLFVNRFFNK